MTPLGAVFWDNDGVLIDSEELYFAACRTVLRKGGIDLSEEQFVAISLNQGRSVFDLARKQGVAPEALAAWREERNQLFEDLLRRSVEPRPGIPDCLAAVRDVAQMAVVTASLRAHFLAAHERTGLTRFFDFVLTNEDVGRSKPHPDPYLKALARAGLPPAACVVVEDSERGLASATAAGLRCIIFPSRLTQNGRFAGALAVAQDAGHLRDLLLTLL